MRRMGWATWLAMVSLVCAGCLAVGIPAEARGQVGDRAAAAQQVERTERELIAAITARDLAAYDRLVADDYVALTVEGTETTKPEIMAAYKAGARQYADLAIHDVKVRVFGDAAVISARTTGSRMENGRAVPNNVRYIRVYALRDGRWRAVMQMAAPLPGQ